MKFDYVDIGFFVIVILLALRGLKTGFVHEFMGTLGVALGVFLASSYCVEASKYLSYAGLEFKNVIVLYTISFVIILAVVWILSLIIGIFLNSIFLSSMGLVYINYVGGYIFCLLKFALILCFIIYGLSKVPFLTKPIEDNTKDSLVYPAAIEVSETVFRMSVIQDKLKDVEDVKDSAEDSLSEEIRKKREEIVKNILGR